MLWSIFITYIITHHELGGFSGLINGLIAAAIGALSMLMSEPTAKSYVKRTCMFVLSIATFTLFYTYIYIYNSPGLLDFGIQLTHSVLNFPKGPEKLFGGIQIAEVSKAVFQADQIKI